MFLGPKKALVMGQQLGKLKEEGLKVDATGIKIGVAKKKWT